MSFSLPASATRRCRGREDHTSHASDLPRSCRQVLRGAWVDLVSLSSVKSHIHTTVAIVKAFGDARLVTASFDASRDKDGNIVPGIGEFEGRYAGAPSSVVNLPEDDEVSGNGEDGDLKKSITKKLTSFFTRG